MTWLKTSAPPGWGMTGCPNLDLNSPTPDDVQAAQLMYLFWTTYSQVLSIIWSISSLSADADTGVHQSAILVCCQSIARIMPIFFLGEAEAALCYQIVSFPMFFALHGLMSVEAPAISADQRRLLHLFRKPAKGGGSLAQFVVGLLEHSPVLRKTSTAKIVTALAAEGVITSSAPLSAPLSPNATAALRQASHYRSSRVWQCLPGV